MHGLKIFVYLTGKEAEALRAELNALGTVDFTTLERYHHRMYTLASSQYENCYRRKWTPAEATRDAVSSCRTIRTRSSLPNGWKT